MTHKNGCHNRPPLRGHCTYGVDWHEGQPLKAVRIEHPHRMSKDCQYSADPMVGSKDPGCIGCKHKQTPMQGVTSSAASQG